jgi:hypothetical protein
MKRFAQIIGLGILMGVAAYAGVHFFGTAQLRAIEQAPAPELGWLKEEFHLGNAEFDRITKLHEAYQSHCAEICRRIDAKNAEVREALARTDHVTPEVEQKLDEAAKLRVECQKSMLQHFFAVSQTMPPEEGRRYLAWVEQTSFESMNGMTAALPATHHEH